jgi:TRAP-type C4-dicarboxylate transport system permease small subunit
MSQNRVSVKESAGSIAQNPGGMRRLLDGLYRATGVLAVTCLVLIGALTISQIVARVIGTIVPSADDFAGFAMAGAVLLGLTYTLQSGGHVRMLVLFDRLRPAARRYAEAGCAGVGTAIAGALIWFTVDMIRTTHKLGEHTLGLVPIPKWIPMLLMLFGLLVLAIALVDDLVRILSGHSPRYRESDAASTLTSGSAE